MAPPTSIGIILTHGSSVVNATHSEKTEQLSPHAVLASSHGVLSPMYFDVFDYVLLPPYRPDTTISNLAKIDTDN